MENLLIKFGLTLKESAAFLELIKLGASPVSMWAKHTGIVRSSMYVMLERFKSEGIVTTFIHKDVLYVQAIPVADLPAILYDKKTSIENTRDLFIKSLPEMQKLEKSYGITPKIKFYEGKNRVEAMYEVVIKEKFFKAFFHPGSLKAIMPEYFHKIPQSLRINGGTAKELLIECKEAEEYKKLYQSDKHKIAMLPHGITFSSDTIITKEKVYLVGYSKTDVAATEIWNEELAQTQSTLFDLIWRTNNKNEAK